MLSTLSLGDTEEAKNIPVPVSSPHCRLLRYGNGHTAIRRSSLSAVACVAWRGRGSFHLGTIWRSQDECGVGAHRTLSRDWDLIFWSQEQKRRGRLAKMGWNGGMASFHEGKWPSRQGTEAIQDAILGGFVLLVDIPGSIVIHCLVLKNMCEEWYLRSKRYLLGAVWAGYICSMPCCMRPCNDPVQHQDSSETASDIMLGRVIDYFYSVCLQDMECIPLAYCSPKPQADILSGCNAPMSHRFLCTAILKLASNRQIDR